MPRVRARYPLILMLLAVLYYLGSELSIIPNQPSRIMQTPPLDPGFYLVLHTQAKLPDNIPAVFEKNFTYIGPLQHVKSCHEMRSKTKPLYPGVATDIIKINTATSQE